MLLTFNCLKFYLFVNDNTGLFEMNSNRSWMDKRIDRINKELSTEFVNGVTEFISKATSTDQ